jgi:tetratricopeptide (TPR) repeat protein
MLEINEKVQAREGTITLPTYDIKGANRNPVFRSQYGVAHIYPYTLLDDIDAKIKDKTYHTLVLENKYLRITVIPDLGGRVYSVFDKVSQREVFYKNSIVRFAPLAIRGAFFSGGLEFSFPVAHAPTTCDKVNWDIRDNEDGSASVSFGGLEHISRLRWMITLTLFPDRCAVAQDVYLYNPGTIPGRYHYWTNASLDANDGTEFIYPLHRARSYEYAGTASWPFARLDLIQTDAGLPGMEGVPMWPANRLHAPVNFRWQKNMLAQVSIFGRGVEWDYFGAWQHKVDHGYAHVANRQDVRGMKLWSWGNAPVGVVNQTALTDDGSLYAETQCGAMETQLDFDFLQPGDIRTWREWWIPLREIGGLTCASETVGARINLTPVSDSESIRIIVALCPAMPYDKAVVTVRVPDKVLIEETCLVSPEKPWIYETTINAVEIADKPITLVVRDSFGRVILENTQNREPGQIDVFDNREDIHPTTADDFYLLGVKHENFDNREQAREAYVKALRVADNHQKAHLRFGLMLLRSAQFREADMHFSRAEALGLVEGSYYRGLIALFESRLTDAEEYFKSAQSVESYSTAAVMGLGKVALRNKNWDQAIGFFYQASQQAAGTVSPATLLAIALRHAGQVEKTHTGLQQVLVRDPLNHPALYEMATGNYPESVKVQRKLQRFLSDDYQYFIDLACYYIDAGLPVDGLEVLKTAWSHKENAMTAYLGAFLSHQIGDARSEDIWLKKARGDSPDFGFPSRLEEVLALQFALEKDSQDSRAKYFLGNFFYAHERCDEAIQLWTEAMDGMDAYDVLIRNLGIGAWQRKNNPTAAIEWFEKALALNPHNQDLYLHLDELYKSQNLATKREQLLDRIKSLQDAREDVHKHRITMMVELGHYQEAIELMAAEKFIPLEMDQSFHEVYVQALMMRAKDHLNAGRIEAAIQDYYKMLEYPENHGVGTPTTRAQAHIYYHIGIAYEKLGKYLKAIKAWREAASEHHPHGTERFTYVQMALDKLSRYSELGVEE